MDRDIVSVLQDLLNRQSLEKPIFRVQYSIEDKNVEKVVFGDDFNVGRLDESDPSAAKGIALPPSVRGTHMMRGAFSRKVLKILKGVVNIPPSANRVWLTRKKDWFYQHTAVDIWNVDTQRDGQIWHHLQPKLWLPTFLLFAWFAKTIFPQSVINMIGKILMQELKKSLTLQPFESQVSLAPGETLYVAICNDDLVFPGVVRVVIDYIMPLTDDERSKLDQVISIISK